MYIELADLNLLVLSLLKWSLQFIQGVISVLKKIKFFQMYIWYK